ncbi:hypothetical protein D3C83_91250 [compost metagenome]
MREPMLPTLMRPVLRPTPIWISGQFRDLKCGCRLFSARCISMAARMPLRACIGSGSGAPQNAMMQSPMYLSMVPRWR